MGDLVLGTRNTYLEYFIYTRAKINISVQRINLPKFMYVNFRHRASGYHINSFRVCLRPIARKFGEVLFPVLFPKSNAVTRSRKEVGGLRRYAIPATWFAIRTMRPAYFLTRVEEPLWMLVIIIGPQILRDVV